MASAQKSVPPPPKPDDGGPSLEVTMKFIEDKIGDQGKFNYLMDVHDPKTRNGVRLRHSVEGSNVKADPAMCKISYHWRTTTDGKVGLEGDFWFDLKEVQSIVVLTAEQDGERVDTDAGHPGLSYKATPEFYVVGAQRPKGVQNSFDFHEEEMANRVAKAMVHAVKLCGGGSKEHF